MIELKTLGLTYARNRPAKLLCALFKITLNAYSILGNTSTLFLNLRGCARIENLAFTHFIDYKTRYSILIAHLQRYNLEVAQSVLLSISIYKFICHKSEETKNDLRLNC